MPFHLHPRPCLLSCPPTSSLLRPPFLARFRCFDPVARNACVLISPSQLTETYRWTTLMHCMCMDGPTAAHVKTSAAVFRNDGRSGREGSMMGSLKSQDIHPGWMTLFVRTPGRRDAEGHRPSLRHSGEYIHPAHISLLRASHPLHLPILPPHHPPLVDRPHRCPLVITVSIQFTYSPFSTPSFAALRAVARLSPLIYTRLPVLLLCVTVCMRDLMCD
ncbi:hypothetical protein B0H10DRAFT_2235015 [Mycena sp. CBHHK59/15]|nr:hypothetical protein B0H10DRAFT_2235015 [Mycena sp. CBHHK59/15]